MQGTRRRSRARCAPPALTSTRGQPGLLALHAGSTVGAPLIPDDQRRRDPRPGRRRARAARQGASAHKPAQACCKRRTVAHGKAVQVDISLTPC